MDARLKVGAGNQTPPTGKRLGRGLGALIPTNRRAVDPPSQRAADADRPSNSLQGDHQPAASVAALGKSRGLSMGAIEIDVPRETTPGSAATPGGLASASLAMHGQQIVDLPLSAISPNPHQPRERFSDDSIRELAESIKSSGLLQPITVRPLSGSQTGRFELIAGERRLRASQALGWPSIPAIVRPATDRESAQFALIENVQRDDLNPAERAFALRALSEDFGQTHQQVADAVGLDRVSVSNLIRLTELDGRTLDLVRNGKLSAGHARALLAVKDLSIRSLLSDTTIMEEWSVRTLEREVQRAVDRAQSASGTRGGGSHPARSAHVSDLESRLSRALGTPVHIQLGRKKGAGRMTIDFFSSEQFEGVLQRLGVHSAIID